MTKTSKACLGKLFAELLEISGAKPWGCGEVVDLLLLYCDLIGEVLNLYGPMPSYYWWKHFVSGFVSTIGDSIPTLD